MEHVKLVRQNGLSCLLPPNVGRTLASLGQYIYAEDEEGVYINQFISSTADTEIKESRMKIKMDSRFCRMEGSAPAVVRTRNPEHPHSWYSEKWECAEWNFHKNAALTKAIRGFCISPGDTRISIDFHGSQMDGANDQVRADAGKTA